MQVRRSIMALVAVTAVAAFAAGCGDDDDESASSGGGSTAASDAAPAAQKTSGEPLRVGVVCACTGPVSGTTGGIPKLVEAWEKQTNATGGINGHPVKAILVDTKNDPATTVQMVKRLIQNDKVQALVAADYQMDSYAKIAAKANIPVTGGNSGDTPFTTQPLFFPSGTTQPTLFYGMANELKKLGKSKTAVLVCAELPVCAGLSPVFDAVAQKVVGGVKVVSTGKVSATAPSYTAQCIKAKGSGADSLMVGHSSDVIVRVADSCAQQGFKPQNVNQASTVSANWLKTPNLNGSISAQQQAPLGTDDTPGMKAFNQAVDQYAGDLKESDQYGEISIQQWSGLELFKKAAQNAKMDSTSTGEDTIKGLYMMKDETLGGIAPPLNFVKGKPTAIVPCYFAQGIENAEYTAPNGSKPICMSSDDAATLGKTLAALAG